MNLTYIKELFELAKKDFKLFSVLILGFVIVFFYNKIDGTNTETKDGLKDCQIELKNKDSKIDTLKEIITILTMEKKIDSIKNIKK